MEKTIEINIQRMADKLKESSTVITIENVKPLRDEINALIEGFNKQIQANNTIVGAKRQKQTECTTKVWELIVFTLQSDITAYRAKRKTFGARTALQDDDGRGKLIRVKVKPPMNAEKSTFIGGWD